jgi:D-alanyl-D-alanine carboxypeptidase
MGRCVAIVTSPPARRAACLALLTALAACGGRPAHHAARHDYNPTRYYPPPGPPSDPWGPYIHEASGRFGVPELWIRRVMRQESGGQEDVISWAGAMGLMQVMPDTYDGLRYRYNLGDDPFDPHNNILAGTAYLREMYDRFGAPGFLAAYNAGPNRLDRYLNNGTPLPEETMNYVAAIAPQLGPGTPMSGPLAAYGGTQFASRATRSGCDADAAYDPSRPCQPPRPATVQTVAYASPAPSYPGGGCDPDAAYDPSRPCQPARPAAVETVAYAPLAPAYSSAGCDPDAAFDPSRPCQPMRAAAAASLPPADCDPDAAFDPSRRCRPQPARPPVIAEPLAPPPPAKYAAGARPLQERMTQRVSYDPAPPPAAPGRWAIQVGAFASLSTAEGAAQHARAAAPDLLRTAKIELPATSPFGSQVAFRARLLGLTQAAAADACARLTSRGMPCVAIPPDRGSF